MSPAARAAVLAVALIAAPRMVSAALDPAKAAADVEALRPAHDGFCTNPPRPLSTRARGLCPLAGELGACRAYADACLEVPVLKPKDAPKERLPGWRDWAAGVAQIAIWIVAAVIVLAILVPLVQLLLRLRRDKELADPESSPAADTPASPGAAERESSSDAELLLRRADEHARKGELNAALYTYLGASLRALDTRGAIRVARHRTNGEYVRGCKEAAARSPLRELVREVDEVQFGGSRPSTEVISRAAARALTIVRALPLVVLFLALGGCQPSFGAPATDPAGDELMAELLRRQGMRVSRLSGSLASLPLPAKPVAASPAVLVDTERTILETETKAHLVEWIEAGGFLVVAGPTDDWPALGVARAATASGAIDAYSADDEAKNAVRVDPARIARPAAIEADGDEVESIAVTGDHKTYAATRAMKLGTVLVLANDDLLTNAALLRPGNAAALVSILRSVD